MAVDGLKQRVTEQALGELTKLVMRDPEKNLVRGTKILEKFATTSDQRTIIGSVRQYFEDAERQDPPPAAMRNVRRVFDSTNEKCRNRLVTNLAMWMRNGTPKHSVASEAGGSVPFVVLMSPTMRCNLRCTGCYAAEYDRKDDLPIEVVERVANEARDMGSFGIILLGGEPFMADGMLDLFDRHSDLTFMVFSNGTLVTDKLASRLANSGNVLVSFSIDGPEAEHEARRGHGTFKRTERGMAALRAAGVPFGFSSMITRDNCETIAGEAFNDYLIDQGCLWGWHFLYMPVGEDPDLNLMPTAEQREWLRTNGAAKTRVEKPLFIFDFWNDAPYVGGCIAGRQYVHVTSSGDVEPCIFTHFATDNVKEKSLPEIMRSPFFQNIRARQPYNPNLLRPCMLIDNTTVSREVMAETGAHPTHKGAEELFTTYAAGIDAYAASYKSIADKAWAEMRPNAPQPTDPA